MILHLSDLEYLRRQYPRYSTKDILSRFGHVASEIRRVVDPALMHPNEVPATLYGAAILKLRSSMEKNQWRRHDFVTGYWALLDQYNKL